MSDISLARVRADLATVASWCELAKARTDRARDVLADLQIRLSLAAARIESLDARAPEREDVRSAA